MKILVVDDHPLIRNAILMIAGDLPGVNSILEADTLEQGLSIVDSDPDVALVLVDLDLPDSSGIDTYLKLRDRCQRQTPSRPRILVLSAARDTGLIERIVCQYRSGFLHKSADCNEMIEALTTTLQGKIHVSELPNIRCREEVALRDSRDSVRWSGKILTPREQEVVELLSKGKSNKVIADLLGIEERTLRAHLTSIYRKLGVPNRSEAIVMLNA